MNNQGESMSSTSIIELVGPAGAGKTTLAKKITRVNNGVIFQIVKPPYFRDKKYIPFFVLNTIRALPIILSLSYQNRGFLTLREIAWVVILNGWWRVLYHQSALFDHNHYIIDQGPISIMSELRIHGQDILRSREANAWWNEIYKCWAKTFRLVIWLDTSTDILIERIRKREKWHPIKGLDDLEAHKEIEHYRVIYADILSSLTLNSNNLTILRFDTGQCSFDQIYDEILVTLQQKAEILSPSFSFQNPGG
jgi:shikimate kinase